jgi:hypothetical protein
MNKKKAYLFIFFEKLLHKPGHGPGLDSFLSINHVRVKLSKFFGTRKGGN